MAIVGCDGKWRNRLHRQRCRTQSSPAPVAMMVDTRSILRLTDLDATATAAIDSLVQQAKSGQHQKSVRLTRTRRPVSALNYKHGPVAASLPMP